MKKNTLLSHSSRQLALFAAAGSGMLLAGAYLFQALGYAPCQMCFWQRYPHMLAIAIGALDLVLAQPPSGRAWCAGRTDDRRHRRFPRRGRAKMVGWPQFLYRCRSRVERAVGAGSFSNRYLRKTCHVRRGFLGLCRPVHARLECGSFGSALRTLDPGPAGPIAQRYPPQPIPKTAGHSTIFRGFSAEFTRKSSEFSRPLHNAISTRNEGSAGLGGRICPVVKSLQNLSNDHVYQYIETVNAPAGGQAGAARCCHRAKCFGLTAGLCRDLFP